MTTVLDLFRKYLKGLFEDCLQNGRYVINEIYDWGCYFEYRYVVSFGNEKHRAVGKKRVPKPNWW